MTNCGFQPRLVIAGLSGNSGKTVVSLGLLLAAREAGVPAAGFKKGPDYIDAAWLSWAGGRPARNLDTWLMGFERVVSSFSRHALADGLNVVEGNRGLYDGLDAAGTHSTAELAKALSAPVVLVVNAAKQTRTAAAVVLGCQRLDPALPLAGVILNRVSGGRHERILRDSIERACAIPVFGALPRTEADALLPERHLGLVTPAENLPGKELRSTLLALAAHLDLDGLLEVARGASALPVPAASAEPRPAAGLTIGYLRDGAFTFYYPENLEALENLGAQLVPVSALSASRLPQELDALYIGGGFPETHADALSANRSFLESLRQAALEGLPIYAECGGLMLLSRAIRWQGRAYPMAAVLPFAAEMCATPQGHGYTCLEVDAPNPFYPPGTEIRGHEFHYSRLVLDGEPPRTACAVRRGSGCFAGRDAVLLGNVWASYTHVHALGTEGWGQGLAGAARRFAAAKRTAGGGAPAVTKIRVTSCSSRLTI